MSSARDDRRRFLRGAAALGGLGAFGIAGCRPALPARSALRPLTVLPRRSADRGAADHGWLDTKHTFSFASYRDPEHMGFGTLRVLNQDRVIGGAGFPMHGHRDMEIVSYVLDGALEHADTMGNGSRIEPGDVQLMSAGKGVRHSEFNGSPDASVHFLQMWVLPARNGTEPRYEQRRFTREERTNRLRLVVSPGGEDGALVIGQDARLRAAILTPGGIVEHDIGPDREAWLHVATGGLVANGVRLEAGDGAALFDGRELILESEGDAECVLWEVARV